MQIATRFFADRGSFSEVGWWFSNMTLHMFVSAAGLSWMTMLERCWPKLPQQKSLNRSRFRQPHRLQVIVVDDDCAPRMTRKKNIRKIRMTFGQWTLVKVPQKAVKLEIHWNTCCLWVAMSPYVASFEHQRVPRSAASPYGLLTLLPLVLSYEPRGGDQSLFWPKLTALRNFRHAARLRAVVWQRWQGTFSLSCSFMIIHVGLSQEGATWNNLS